MLEHESLLDPHLAEQTWGSARPAGIIFHVSRCGSTLIANAFREIADAVVLSEAPVIDSLMHWAASPVAYWSDLGARVLPAMTAVFANYRGSGSQPVVLKCAPEGIVALGAVRARFPGVPCVVMIRNPIEVLVSNVTAPPQWMVKWYEQPRSPRFGTPPAAAYEDGFTGFCAWIIGRWCSVALAALDESCWVLDYEDVSPTRLSGSRRRSASTPCRNSATSLSGYLAEARSGQVQPFEPDAEKKRLAADAVMASSVAKWAYDPYCALLSRAQRIRRPPGGVVAPEV